MFIRESNPPVYQWFGDLFCTSGGFLSYPDFWSAYDMVLLDIRYLRLSMIPGIFMIFIGMVFSIKDEVDALTLNDRYRSLL